MRRLMRRIYIDHHSTPALQNNYALSLATPGRARFTPQLRLIELTLSGFDLRQIALAGKDGRVRAAQLAAPAAERVRRCIYVDKLVRQRPTLAEVAP
jgi:hypothetical protein